jgi:hypothetical protein
MLASGTVARRPRSVFTLIFRITSTALAVLLLGAVVAYFPVAHRYGAGHVFVVENNKPITFTAAAGERVVLGVRLHGAVNGLWGTSGGLRVTLTGGQSVPLVNPVAHNWGDRISTSAGGSSDVAIAGTFTVPDPGSQGPQSLEGTIDGTVDYPTGSGYGFKDVSMPVAVPLHITVRPRGDLSAFAAGPLLTAIVQGCVALAAALLGCALIALVRTLWWFRKPGASWGWAIIGALIAGVGLLVGAVLLESSATPHAAVGVGLPAIPVSEWLFPSLLSAAAAVSVFAWWLRSSD